MARKDDMGVQVRNETQDEDLVRLYLDSIGRYPLITKEQEWDLSRLIHEGREAKERVAKGNLKEARKGELLAAAELGDAATEQFINSNLRLVVSIAKRYQSSELPLLDLVQEGNLGLIHAVSKFDWRKGFKFSTYATWWIKQAISRGIDNTGRRYASRSTPATRCGDYCAPNGRSRAKPAGHRPLRSWRRPWTSPNAR
jgi:DNA-directed RNA polymerase sigma subunit (sigma70/sigma32)